MQAELNLTNGEYFGAIRKKPVKIPVNHSGNGFAKQNELPLNIPDFDPYLNSRPADDGGYINRYGYDRWNREVHGLAKDYYEKYCVYQMATGAKKPINKYLKALDCLLVNFVRNKDQGCWCRVSRNRSDGKKNDIGTDILINLIDWLSRIGDVDYRPGWQGANGNDGSGKMTTVRPDRELLRRLRSIPLDCVGTEKTRPVIVLNRKTGEGQEREEIPKEKWSNQKKQKAPREAMGKLVHSLNTQWENVIVRAKDRVFEQVYFKAVFNNDFLHGGRIYEYGGAIQNMPSKERKFLRFDDQHVAEADYSGCQWRIQYALEKLEFSEDDDPYQIPGFNREVVKAAAQPIGYGSSIESAIQSLKSKQNPANKGKKDHNDRDMFVPVLQGIDIDKLVQEFIRKHEPIAHKFCSPDYALKMQREDSKLMSDILKRAQKEKILAYPIHDSVIVPVQHQEWLEMTMRDCFKKRYGFHCPVDVKYPT